MWLCRARMGPLVADPDICPPGQHAVPDEHAPLMSTIMSDAVQDDATEVGVHLAVCIAATNIQSLMCWPSCTLYLHSAHGQAASIDFYRCQAARTRAYEIVGMYWSLHQKSFHLGQDRVVACRHPRLQPKMAPARSQTQTANHQKSPTRSVHGKMMFRMRAGLSPHLLAEPHLPDLWSRCLI